MNAVNSNNEVQEHLNKDSAHIPYFIEFDRKYLQLYRCCYSIRFELIASTHLSIWFNNTDIKSEFVEFTLYFTSTELPARLRPYLDIYFESFFSLPLVDPATKEEIHYEQVVKMLDNDTVSRDCGNGVGSSFRQLALVVLKTERAKYSEGIAWLQKMTWNTRFDADRLKVIATKLLNDIPQQKRDGSRVGSLSCSLDGMPWHDI